MHWLDQGALERIGAFEATIIKALLTDMVGVRAVQIGPVISPVEESLKVSEYWVVEENPRPQTNIRAHAQALPLASSSIDIVILGHTHEASGEPAQIIGEAHRVLKGEGRLIVAGFRGIGRNICRVGHRPGIVPFWHLNGQLRAAGFIWERRLPVVYAKIGQPMPRIVQDVIAGGYVAVARKRELCAPPMRLKWQRRKNHREGWVHTGG